MAVERELERLLTIKKLRGRGYFIILMGVLGLAFYYFDVAQTREHPVVVLLGTLFCVGASMRMFYLAQVVKNWRD